MHSSSELVLASQCWRDVDGNAAAAMRYLDRMGELIAGPKQRSLDLLRLAPGMSAIDIGCGVGRDAVALAERVGPAGRVVGLDRSDALIAEATARAASLGLPLAFSTGDAQALAFADGSFDAARTERVLQHLDDPARAVREMVRVVRPGGRIVALEPDWDTVMVAGADLAATRAVVRHKADCAVAHGTIGRELRGLLIETGCRDVAVELCALTFDGLALADRAMGLADSFAGARRAGSVSADRAAAWWQALEANERAGTFFAAMCGVIACATVGVSP
ncbi:MAG: methyltransferase domain-containing protein [Alphaproteobacteria bacterium]|nr:methyltransferase domain-containing protein [Alphaproteobacteria bacterium]